MSSGDEERVVPAWSRFSIVDCAILIAAVALAMGLLRIFAGTGQALQFSAPAVAGYLGLSGIIAGPLVLAGQWLRGRRSGLSAGEWFWITPILLFLVCLLWVRLASACNFAAAGFLPPACLTVQLLCSFASLIWFFIPRPAAGPGIGRRWTDYLGHLVCVTTGIFSSLTIASLAS